MCSPICTHVKSINKTSLSDCGLSPLTPITAKLYKWCLLNVSKDSCLLCNQRVNSEAWKINEFAIRAQMQICAVINMHIYIIYI